MRVKDPSLDARDDSLRELCGYREDSLRVLYGYLYEILQRVRLTETLREIFASALDRTDPAVRTAEAVASISAPLSIVAFGKAAARMYAGAAEVCAARSALVVIPRGYEAGLRFTAGSEVLRGGHPRMTAESFEAGRRLTEFVEACENDILFLVSGGGSACVEHSLNTWFSMDDLITINDELIRSDQPIQSINIVRKHLSAIKGGRLGMLVRHALHTCVYSDVPIGQPGLVASGPTVRDPSTNEDAAAILDRCSSDAARRASRILRSGEVPETPKGTLPAPVVAADNGTLVGAACDAARARGLEVMRLDGQLDGDVELVASQLADAVEQLSPGSCVVAGGEPTVHVRGPGVGGRCSELAARFLGLAGSARICGLFAASDGRDGNSPAAGFVVDGKRFASHPFSEWQFQEAIARSDTYGLLEMAAEPIIIPPTGNNLRDLVLLARE